MKAIIFLGVFLFAAVLGVNASEESEDNYGFQCTPGVRYVENACNGCFCGPTYGLGCTLMGCRTHQEAKYMNCAKGTTWKDGCEQCWCINLGTLCTTDCGKVHEEPK